MPTRIFTVAELTALGVPPDTHDDLMVSDHLIADEFVTTLKYSAQRRVIFRAPDDGKTYAVGYEGRLDVGDFEYGDGPSGYGWHGDTVEGVEVEEEEITVTQWVPVD